MAGSVAPAKPDRRRRALVAFAIYAATFALFVRRWLPHADAVIPGTGHLTDTEYYVWVIGWVAHALAREPTRLFAAPFNYPAPAQLAGTEWFASSHLVSAPVYWLTGNPVLAANVLGFVSYPLAATAMACLLVVLGCGPLVAWAGGFIFATGPLRLPFNLLLFEYQNLFLPLAVLALVRLRDRPDCRRALSFGLAYTLGVFSSYYTAAMLTGVVALWTACELLRPAGGRARFAGLAAIAVAVALGLLVVASAPYLARASSGAGVRLERATPFSTATIGKIAAGLRANLKPSALRGLFDGRLEAVLGICALVAAWTDRDLRRAVVGGLAITLTVLVVRLGWWQFVGWMPESLRFFRDPVRLAVVIGFGTTLLVATGLEAIRRRLGTPIGALVVIVVAVSIVLARGPRFAVFPQHRELAMTDHASVYAAVGAAAGPRPPGGRRGGPRAGSAARPDTLYDGRAGRSSFEPAAMLGGLIHHVPLVNGYTAYHPPHRQLVLESIARLPAADALQDLVDMTHVEFLLLRPAAYWAEPALRTAMMRIPGTRPLLAHDGWVLLHVEPTPRHPEWFTAIAAGTRPDQTALGTPLAALGADAAVARVDASAFPARMPPRTLYVLDVTVHNEGTAGWPVAAPPRPPLTGKQPAQRDLTVPFVVHLVTEWRQLPDEDRPGRSQDAALLHDVPPGESVVQRVWIVTPEQGGDYELVVRVVQTGGAAFDAPANAPFRTRVTIGTD
jgi:hypothetical protein